MIKQWGASRGPLIGLALMLAVAGSLQGRDGDPAIPEPSTTGSAGTTAGAGTTGGAGSGSATGASGAAAGAATRSGTAGAVSSSALLPPKPGIYRYEVVSGGGAGQVTEVSPAVRGPAGWEQVSRGWEPGNEQRWAEATRRWTDQGLSTTSLRLSSGGCVYDPPVVEVRYPILVGDIVRTDTTCGPESEVVQVTVLGKRTVRIGGSKVSTFLLERREVIGRITHLRRAWFAPSVRLFVQQTLGITTAKPEGRTLRLTRLEPLPR